MRFSWEGFNHAVQASIITRAIANLFACAILLCALLVATTELIRGEALNQYVLLVLGTGIGYALNVMGINQGVTLAPMKQLEPVKQVEQQSQDKK